jgi:N-acetylglucosaminyldiphosphoundecaprenol N-acetyl-beta-D-mannosaminyltransferase
MSDVRYPLPPAAPHPPATGHPAGTPAGARPSPDPRVLFGLPFDNLSMREAVSRIDDYIRSGTPHLVFTANVAMLVQWHRSASLRRIYEDTDLLTVDGMALVYAARLLQTPVKEPVSGSSLFFEIMSLARMREYRVFLLGADADVLCAARRRIERTYHPIRIVGAHHGYFGDSRRREIADLIAGAKPDILLLGISSPLKEQFAWTYRDHMNVPLIVGVGGMFDIVAGRWRRAPAWVQAMCLEWLWRLAHEPRRLWRRYASTNTIFLGLLAREMFRARIAGPAARCARRSAHRLLA